MNDGTNMIKIFSQLFVALTVLCLWAQQASAQVSSGAMDDVPWSMEEDSFLRELGIIDNPFWGFSEFENRFLNELLGFNSRMDKKKDGRKKQAPKALGRAGDGGNDFVPPVGPKLPAVKPVPPSNKDMDDFIESMMKELTEPKVIPFDDPKLTLARLAIGWRR